ncbi:MAG TPA: helix-turn-helix transcriptional regulator [Polyangiaceae bacterium]
MRSMGTSGRWLRYEQVRSAVRLLGETAELAGDLEAQRTHLADGLLRVLGASAVVNGAMGRPVGRERMQFNCSSSLSEADREMLIGAPAQRGAWHDPRAHAHLGWLAKTRSLQPLTATRQQLVEDKVWYNSRFVSEYQRITGLDHTVCSMRRGEGSIFAQGMVIFRERGDRAFDEHDVALLDLIHIEWAMLSAPKPGPPDPFRAIQLSRRERETLGHLLEGRAYKEIADHMQLATHTVNEYVKRIYRKLDVHSRGELQAMWSRLSAKTTPR